MGKRFDAFIGFVVDKRLIFLIVFVVLSIVCLGLNLLVEVNYDLTSYLPDNSRTKKSYDLMKKEFESTGTAGLVIENISKLEAYQAEIEINKVKGVSISKMTNYNTEKNATLINIFLMDGDYTKEAEKCLKDIIDALKKHFQNDNKKYYKIGIASTAGASRASIEKELPLVLTIAVVFVLIVLCITTESFFEPIVLIVVIFSAIFLNYGTNLILKEISFISNAIAAVLLVALAMDYSIVLVSRYREEENKHPGDEVAAMKKALSGAFITITSSGLTVLAGILSLIFMENKIGLDMGLVLAKGVLISIIAVLFFMPSVLLYSTRLIKKTHHRNLLKGVEKIGICAKATRFIFPPIFLLLGVAAIIVQSEKLDIKYLAEMANKEIQRADDKATELFDVQNSLVTIYPFETAIQTQIEISNKLQEWNKPYKGIINFQASYFTTEVPIPDYNITLTFISEVTRDLMEEFGIDNSTIDKIFEQTVPKRCEKEDALYLYEFLETINKTEIFDEIYKSSPLTADLFKLVNDKIKTPADKFFRSDDKLKYIRMMSNIKSHPDSEDAFEALNTIKDEYFQDLIDKQLLKDYYIVCNSENSIETKDVFQTDKLKVELISSLAVLVIVVIALRSALVPIVLVIAIFGSIMLNLAFNALIKNKIFYICFLLGHAIQMGATIDYGILLTDRYLMARKKETKFDAIRTAIRNSFTTIISSGSILVFAALTIGIVCTVKILKEIGYLISLGGLFATLTMLFVLPQALLLLDTPIYYTTYKPNFIDFGKPELKEKLNEDESDNTDISKNPLFRESSADSAVLSKQAPEYITNTGDKKIYENPETNDEEKKIEEITKGEEDEKKEEIIDDQVNAETKNEY